jgi:predicted glycogen debranching enzyme
MNPVVHRIGSQPLAGDVDETLLTREWLVTNGMGGYASGTVSGVPTRRFHGMLVAALAAPLARTMMLNDLVEEVSLDDGSCTPLAGEEVGADGPRLHGTEQLREFRLELGLPVWTYAVGPATVEKRVVMPYRQNTVHVSYRVLSGAHLRLRLRPALHFRPHEGRLEEMPKEPYVLTVTEDRYELKGPRALPALRVTARAPRWTFTCDPQTFPDRLYRIERNRGYDARGALWSPGHFEMRLSAGESATLIASTESWDTIRALQTTDVRRVEEARRQFLIDSADPRARDGVAAELVLAADQFLISPAGRPDDLARARASGEELRTVIAGYHWFTDWGRDTMISLEGLTLATGRHNEAGWILRTFAHYVRDGLIPNMFPEGEKEGLYHTADASLWFFHAVSRYVQATGDRATLRLILPKLEQIVQAHLRGTRFGIGVDPRDGLLRQGAEGYQLTWMDAKVDGWVVTPRRGKAVEINALWYNALRVLQAWHAEEGDAAAADMLGAQADRARESFNARFWYAEGGHLYDVVDGEHGNDSACRPNQLLAVSLPHAVLDPARWSDVLQCAHDRLLTPVGLRSLAPGHPDYKERYYGDLRARDAAYHQGTVWGWLIGPFVDAWLKVHPDDRAGARRFLEGFVPHLDEACIGSVSEIFDAAPPFTARGCCAQAWSVAEVLRCWLATEPPQP